ncbi:helix-turn-helix transcriptional regulator [Paenibacillus sp. FSL E2-0151]|uniref:helix-turn-helix domain-containing protein n=1 Tax=Paenibacillus sp. FSL E2-0151 TaxID=2921357 RepID=UPI0030EDD868
MNPVVRNIESLRKQKRMTMKEISDHCGKTIPWYADIAKGRRRIYLDDMLLIAEAMKEDPSIFFAQQLSVTLNPKKTA